MLKPKAPNVLAHWSLLVEDFNTSALAFYESVEAAVRRREVPDVTFSRVRWKEGNVASAEREYLRVQRGRLAFDICAAPFGRGYFFSSWLARVPFGNALGWLALFLVAVFVLGMALFIFLGMVSSVTQSAGVSCGFTLLFLPALFIAVPAGLWLLGLAVHQGRLLDEDTVVSMPVVGYLYTLVFNPHAYYRIDTALMFQNMVHNAVTEVIDELRSAQGLRALAPEERKPTIREFMR